MYCTVLYVCVYVSTKGTLMMYVHIWCIHVNYSAFPLSHDDVRLSEVQVRQVFAAYLTRVRERLLKESRCAHELWYRECYVHIYKARLLLMWLCVMVAVLWLGMKCGRTDYVCILSLVCAYCVTVLSHVVVAIKLYFIILLCCVLSLLQFSHPVHRLL